ncbi:MAG: DDE-type integrase/transposase/recombinase [Kiritimatiellales bacterium]|nr:DDE-type integrase/transposase/recombinase [Kiritimatiellales bacterium]
MRKLILSVLLLTAVTSFGKGTWEEQQARAEEISAEYQANHKRVARLMQRMGLQAITPGPHTSKPAPGHKIYPYLLRGVDIERVGQVWSTDITYIPMRHGFMYLTAVIDWYSRYVLAWELSNTLDSLFCVAALDRALSQGMLPEIFNTDQGSQFTSEAFTSVLLDKEIAISMDGAGGAPWTMYSSSGSGGRSNTRRSIPKTMPMDTACTMGLGTISATTTTKGNTRRWTREPRARYFSEGRSKYENK